MYACARSELGAPIPDESQAVGAVVVEHQFDERRSRRIGIELADRARRTRMGGGRGRGRGRELQPQDHLVRARGHTRLRRHALVRSRNDRVELLLGALPRVEAHQTKRCYSYQLPRRVHTISI